MSVKTPDSQRVEARIDTPSEPVNILLVDDEQSNLKALEAVLAADDRRLMWAQSGEDALRWLLKERFAVILLDVFMPGMDGFETAELIRQHVRSQSTPIIFLTAASKDSTHISRGYALGAVDYILKPLDVSILRSKVDVFVDLFRKTEQVRRQAELLTEARGFLQNVLESTTDYAIIALDLSGVVMAWYEGARLLYGYTSDEVLGSLNVGNLFSPEEVDSGRMQRMFDAALSAGRAEDVFEHVRRDGERFTASVSVNPRRDAVGNVMGHVLVVKDITQQRLQEERARLLIREQAARAEAETANRRFALLAAASSELSRLLDNGSALQSVARLTATDLAEACIIDLITQQGEIQRIAAAHREPDQEQPLQDLTAPDPETPCFARVLGGEPVILPDIPAHDLHQLTSDPIQAEAIRPFEFGSAMIVPIPGRDGVLGAIWLFSTRPERYGSPDLDFALDLANRVGLALDNARLYREAQDAVTAREEFLSVASHELRTPITSLRGQAQLMIRQLDAKGMPDPERLLRAFRVIDVQSDRLTRLLSQLLDVSRLQAGKLELERSQADLRSIVAEVVTRTQAATSTHSIELRVPEELVAHIDPLRLEQVVTNLLDNAVKYSPEGGRVEVELSRSEANTLRLAVRDWGEGIPPEHRAHIFDRFHQGPGRYRSSGMGLGLYISRQIVELHGGQIEAEFPPDGGTRFVVTLPTEISAATQTVSAPGSAEI